MNEVKFLWCNTSNVNTEVNAVLGRDEGWRLFGFEIRPHDGAVLVALVRDTATPAEPILAGEPAPSPDQPPERRYIGMRMAARV